MTKPNFNLETNQYLSNCDSKDVIALNSKGLFYIHKLCELVLSSLDRHVVNTIASSITQKLANQCSAKLWFEDGESCEILKAGASGWQKEKIKFKVNLTLEFIPDEPEIEKSPLDDVRQEINRNNTVN
ncbi:MAG: hypothetical protein Tsb0014_17290 [Pleurocapsa sp.]